MDDNEILKQVPILFEQCDLLLELAHEMLTGTHTTRREDHTAFMLIAFAAKQRLHFESLGVLASGGCFADMKLIARTMLDGLALVKWSMLDPEQRPLAWRSYALVQDFQLIQEQRRRGEAIDERYEQELLARLDQHGDRFLRRNKNPESRDYVRRWHVDENGRLVVIEEMMKDVAAGDLYRLYDEFSAWSHWNPRGIGGGMKETADGFAFRWDDEANSAAPLAVGFQCLWETLAVFNDYLDLGWTDRLRDVRDQYIDSLSKGKLAT